MRVIAGTLKRRTLLSPTWEGLRPTSDALRETLFNILGGRVEGARVLDGFAGTGAVGIEALSRGAAHVTFVDRDRRALDLVSRNLARCGIETGATVVRADMGRPGGLPPGPYDVIVLDPPYEMEAGAAVAAAATVLAPGGTLVLEHARRRSPPEGGPALAHVRTVTAGDSALAFYRRAALPAEAEKS